MKKHEPIVALPVPDRLGFILPWGLEPDNNQAEIVDVIRQRLARAIAANRCEVAYPKAARYRLNFRIKLLGENVLVQIGSLQPDVGRGGIRILANPSKWVAGDVELLHRTLRRLIGRDYDQLMLKPAINVLDFAVDILHVNLSRMLVTYTNAQRHTIFGKRLDSKGNVETYNFGSVTSDYMTAAYDKRAERVNAAIVKIARRGLGSEPFTANFLKQFKAVSDSPERLRIEVRGKKMRGLKLSQLLMMTNRFERFAFTDFDADGAKLSRLTELAFIALCQQYDLKTAFALFKNTPQARKVRKYWRDRQVDWWQPIPMWDQACESLRAIGLFAPEAFNDEPEPSTKKRRR